MTTLAPGFHADIPDSVYHKDPAPEPSLSSSMAKVILDQSPLHAWHQHPRLNAPPEDADTEETEAKPTRPKEIGSAAHRLILGRGKLVRVIEGSDYKSKTAQAARAAAYAAGASPILRSDFEKAEAMAKAVQAQAATIEGCEAFREGVDYPSELVAIAQDPSGVYLRILIDRLEDHGDHATIWDVKTGDVSAAPTGLGRRIFNMQMEVQAALYERVVVQLRPELAGRIRFRWLFVENDPPHLIMPAELDATGMEIGRRKVEAAIELFRRGMQNNDWPGYPPAVVTAEYPSFAATAWETREAYDPMLAGITYGSTAPIVRPVEMMTEVAP